MAISFLGWFFVLLLALCRCHNAVDVADSASDEENCGDSASFLQVQLKKQVEDDDYNVGNFDIVFADLPMNFGEDVAKWAMFGANASDVSFSDIAQIARNSPYSSYRPADMAPGFWNGAVYKALPRFEAMKKPGMPAWGPLNPKLQDVGEFNPELPGLSCPMFYTPQKYWPSDLAKEYFGPPGTKEIFANLRNPFEMITAIFRMSHDMVHPHNAGPYGVVEGFNVTRWNWTVWSNDGITCADPSAGLYGDINKWVKTVIPNMSTFQLPLIPVEVGCYLQPQAPFFDGPYGVNHPLDMREMPHTATEYLKKHGIDVSPGIRPNHLMHVTSCDNTWAGDFDEEAKALVLKYYKRDFELACEYFGHCNFTEPVCNQHIPGMCPSKVFSWNETAGTYTKRA